MAQRGFLWPKTKVESYRAGREFGEAPQPAFEQAKGNASQKLEKRPKRRNRGEINRKVSKTLSNVMKNWFFV